MINTLHYEQSKYLGYKITNNCSITIIFQSVTIYPKIIAIGKKSNLTAKSVESLCN